MWDDPEHVVAITRLKTPSVDDLADTREWNDAFIVAARVAIPRLCTELEALSLRAVALENVLVRIADRVDTVGGALDPTADAELLGQARATLDRL